MKFTLLTLDIFFYYFYKIDFEILLCMRLTTNNMAYYNYWVCVGQNMTFFSRTDEEEDEMDVEDYIEKTYNT